MKRRTISIIVGLLVLVGVVFGYMKPALAEDREAVTLQVVDHDYLFVKTAQGSYWVSDQVVDTHPHTNQTLTHILRDKASGQLSIAEATHPKAISLPVHQLSISERTIAICGKCYRLLPSSTAPSERLNITALFPNAITTPPCTLVAGDPFLFKDQCRRLYCMAASAVSGDVIKQAVSPVKWENQRVYTLTYQDGRVTDINHSSQATTADVHHFGGIYQTKTGQYAVQYDGHYYVLVTQPKA
ncbi:MAG: hypothetical protein Q4A67_06105 [Aerococcus sp.]|nr:hypothetical protein [Aerococcus sp.]